MAIAHSGGYRCVLAHDFNSGDPRKWFEWTNLAEPLKEHPWLPPDSVYVGRTLLELSELLGTAEAARFRIMVAWWFGVEAILPHVGNDVIVLCLGDGLGRKPRYSHDVRLVAKTHGVTRRPYVPLGPRSAWSATLPTLLQECRVQLIRLPAAGRSMLRTVVRRRRASFVEIPLGTYLLSDVPFVPFDGRAYDISFAGSMRTDGQERRRILPRKTRSRNEMIRRLEALKSERPDLRVALNLFKVFGEARSHEEGYSELMMQTRLALCPRGGYLETYRLFEAAASGCIPITETLPRREYYEGCPAVRVRSWLRLDELVTDLLADRAALQRLHETTLEWWRNQCSPRATARRIASALARSTADAGT